MDFIQASVFALASLGVCQAVFLSIYLLLSKRGNQLANFLLALVLIGLSIRIGKSIFNHFLIIEPWHRNIGLAGLLLVAPSFFLYTRVLSEKVSKLDRRALWHFVPAVVYFTFCWLIPNQRDPLSYFSYSLVTGHMLAYMAVSEYEKRKFAAKEPDQQRLAWLHTLSFGLWFLWCYYFLVFVGLLPYYLGGAISYSVLIYCFSYLLMHRSHLSLFKYSGSKISSQATHLLMKKIDQYFDSDKPFLQTKLSLQAVAESMNEDPRDVSRAINQARSQNFSEYVNQHRVENAKVLLLASSQKVASVAIESGFGNVTSFNQTFKSITNQTPSQFRRQSGLQ